MARFSLFLLSYVMVLCTCHDVEKDYNYKWPTVGISILVRNKESTLPYFLSELLRLEYPTDRMYIWIHSDHNEDSTLEILNDWAKIHSSKFKQLKIELDYASEGKKIKDQKHRSEWTPERYQHVINMREKAMQLARNSWAEYIFMLDADILLTNHGTLKELVSKNLQVVAPMLLSDGLYSNFWGGMTNDYYYRRSDNYEELIHRKVQGCFKVPMVHSAVLISLNHHSTDNLTYDPKKLKNSTVPHDDIISFALSAKENGVEMFICNDNVYGFIPIPAEDGLASESEQVDNVKLEAYGRGIDLPVDPSLEKFVKLPKKTKYGLKEIYMINLERRVYRRHLMMRSFDTLGMDVQIVKAVDGKSLKAADLKELSVFLMPNYEDPYHKRPMKAGEIGCFLSHYYIWTDIAKRNLATALILEDDIHFAPYFRERFAVLMDELKGLDWDLVYIGRKVLMDNEEEYVTNHIKKPLYSYWTLGYLLSDQGARKLINAEPLAKMLPVDEFLPIMFNKHPNETWKFMFPNRNLKALSASPLLVSPSHYTGEPGYVSDTEDSYIMSDVTTFSHRFTNEL